MATAGIDRRADAEERRQLLATITQLTEANKKLQAQLDTRLWLEDVAKDSGMELPKLVRVSKDHPRILYVTGDLRVVLRPLARYPAGYVEIERTNTNAMGLEYWSHIESFSLDTAEYNRHWKAEQTPLYVLVHFLRTLVPELQK